MPGSPAAAALLAPLLFVFACGCQPARYARTAADAEMFGAQAVRIHPTFTRAKDWSGDGKPDGVEAVLELQDEFGEPTRATGKARFEVYQYRPYHPDPRGRRVPGVWEWPLGTRQEQAEHWSRALRAYTFKIPYDPANHTVVLAATFELDGGTPRLFDQIILEPSGRTAPAPVPAPAPGLVPAPGAEKSPARTTRRPRAGQVPATQPAAAQPDAPAGTQPATPPPGAPPATQPSAPDARPPVPETSPPAPDAADTPPAGPDAVPPPR